MDNIYSRSCQTEQKDEISTGIPLLVVLENITWRDWSIKNYHELHIEDVVFETN